MSAYEDAKRYLWLGDASTDEPIELLRNLVGYLDRVGLGTSYNVTLLNERIKIQARVAELETELKESKKKSAAQIELLEHQLKHEHLYKRVQDLETKLKESKSETAAFRRVAMQRSSQDKKR